MSDAIKPAYLVVCGTVLGEAVDPQYAKRAGPAALEANLRPIAGGAVATQAKVLEGELPPGTTIMVVEQFPSMAALDAFYFSEAYQSAIPLRAETFKVNFLVALDGISDAEVEARRKAALGADRAR